MPSAFPAELKGPVIDTGVLFDFLAWRFSEETQFPLPSGLGDSLRSRPLEELRWYLSLSKPIHTSSQVVAEVYYLAVKSRRRFRDRALIDPFWKLAQKEFLELDLTEHSVALMEMDSADFLKFGPADCSVLTLAVRRSAPALAHDAALQTRCREREIPVIDYSRIVSLWGFYGAGPGLLGL